jgi:spore germination cell wall hydrolase CwlJ-like protein
MKKLVSILLLALLLLSNQLTAAKVPMTQELQCLTDNIYHESRGQPFQGQLAVALVTINRTKINKFPSTICGVVYQKGQFTWTTSKLKITDLSAYNVALLAATLALDNNKILGDFTATYYHNNTVNPKWGHRRVAIIGNHIFYV